MTENSEPIEYRGQWQGETVTYSRREWAEVWAKREAEDALRRCRIAGENVAAAEKREAHRCGYTVAAHRERKRLEREGLI